MPLFTLPRKDIIISSLNSLTFTNVRTCVCNMLAISRNKFWMYNRVKGNALSYWGETSKSPTIKSHLQVYIIKNQEEKNCCEPIFEMYATSHKRPFAPAVRDGITLLHIERRAGQFYEMSSAVITV